MLKKLFFFVVLLALCSTLYTKGTADEPSMGSFKWTKTTNEDKKSPTRTAWKNLLQNGDAELDWSAVDAVCAYGKVYSGIYNNDQKSDPALAVITTEADGNRCFVVRAKAVDPDEYPNFFIDEEGTVKQDVEWMNQFWIQSPKEWKTGETFKVSFRYKASKETGAVETQVHRKTPGDYLFWRVIGDVTFDTEWQTYEREVTVESDMDGMWSIVFNLGANGNWKEDIDFYFDDLKWETIIDRDIESEIAADLASYNSLVDRYNSVMKEVGQYPKFEEHQKARINRIYNLMIEICKILDTAMEVYEETGEYESPQALISETNVELDFLLDQLQYIIGQLGLMEEDRGRLEEIVEFFSGIRPEFSEYPDFYAHKRGEIDGIANYIDELCALFDSGCEHLWNDYDYVSVNEYIPIAWYRINTLYNELEDYTYYLYIIEEDRELFGEVDNYFFAVFDEIYDYPEYYQSMEEEILNVSVKTTDLDERSDPDYRLAEYWENGPYYIRDDIYAFIAEVDALKADFEAYIENLQKTSIEAADLAALVAVQQELEGSFGWTNVWNLTGTEETVEGLQGVTITDGKVTAIDLSDMVLTGLFPTTVLALPNVISINLSHNNLSGDIGTTMTALVRQQPTLTAKITSLDLSHNAYTGNVGLLAKCFPSLTALYVQNNRFATLAPALAANITDVDISHQTIDQTIDFNLSNINMTQIAKQIPTIVLYDTDSRKYRTDLNIMCTDSEEGSFVDDGQTWIMQVRYANSNIEIPYVSSQNSFRCPSGTRLSVVNLYPDNTVEGSQLYIRFYFEQGDANFDGAIDVLDLMSMILKAFEEYPGDRPYNFTASNLYVDETINVQDVVMMVDLMAGQSPTTKAAKRVADQAADPVAYCSGGQLYISSAVPVAAFDVTVLGDISGNLPVLRQYGFDYCLVRTSDYTRIIAYSMSGATLPAGITAIAETDSQGVAAAMLSDSQAQQITQSAAVSALDSLNGDGTTKVRYSDGTLSIDTADASLTWAIYGLDGTLLAQGTEHTADISYIPTGCYIVTVTTETYGIESTKIIIKK